MVWMAHSVIHVWCGSGRLCTGLGGRPMGSQTGYCLEHSTLFDFRWVDVFRSDRGTIALDEVPSWSRGGRNVAQRNFTGVRGMAESIATNVVGCHWDGSQYWNHAFFCAHLLCACYTRKLAMGNAPWGCTHGAGDDRGSCSPRISALASPAWPNGSSKQT